MMNLYNIGMWSAVTGFMVLLCYILIKLIVKIELKKGIDPQIKEFMNIFKGKDVRLVIRINRNGEAVTEHFELVTPPDYMG